MGYQCYNNIVAIISYVILWFGVFVPKLNIKCSNRHHVCTEIAVASVFAQQAPNPRKPPAVRASPAGTSHADAAGPSMSPATSPCVSSPSVSADHAYVIKDSPRTMKRKMNSFADRASAVQKRLKYGQTKIRRLKKKCQSLSEVVHELKKKQLISSNCEEMLKQSVSGVPQDVMKRILHQKSKVPSRSTYPEELRSFALTLSFYSMKAYNYVRKTFQLALPHPSTLRTWYRGLNGRPGFTDEAFAALALRVDEESKNERRVVCGLVFDEMAIRKHVEWDGRKFLGYVDVGSGVDSDSVPVAKEVLVMMLVSLNSNWKIPCGYFFIDGLTGEERANLVRQCLLKAHDVGVLVASVTCDGPSCNFAMMDELGIKVDPPNNMKTSFPHPADPSMDVHFVLDACHMLKLVRNCFSSYGILKDRTGGKINWQYILALHKLQESEGLRLANRLSNAHVTWEKSKMKVRLAAQTLSASVADALEYCNVHLKLSQFAGCEATVHFLRIIDRLFDLLNSRNPFAKGFKSALKPSNFSFWRPFVDEVRLYLLGLTDYLGTPMYKTKRRTAFVGLLCTIDSVLAIYSQYVDVASAHLKYFLTYKISQDHIELFFGGIRAACGSNNNPTVRQFISVYKRMLMRHNVQGGLGNCVVLDDTCILPAASIADDSSACRSDSCQAAVARFYDLAPRMPLCADHDYADVPNISVLSEYKQAAVNYIAGYVVRMVRKRVSCMECQTALVSPESSSSLQFDTDNLFVKFKDHGGLIKPSKSVIVVCREAEKCFGRMKAVLGSALPMLSDLPAVFSTVVLAEVGMSVFPSLKKHMFDSTVESNHIFHLIKVVVACYVKVRMHHLAKQKTAEITGVAIRKQLSKLILFKNQ